MKVNIFWFRRDLRLHDNTALNAALNYPNVKPIFIFDQCITQKLKKDDPRLSFIYSLLKDIDDILKKYNSGIHIYIGEPKDVWLDIVKNEEIETVYWNRDYEPYALKRDLSIIKLLQSYNIKIKTFKDQVIFEKSEIVKNDNSPYVVYTPYKKKWLQSLKALNLDFSLILNSKLKYGNFLQSSTNIPSFSDLGFVTSDIMVKPFTFDELAVYDVSRDFPSQDKTSYLGPHLRFGSVSIRQCVFDALNINETFLSELIWREFFMQILYHFPFVENSCFKSKYNNIKWRNNQKEFNIWCLGQTGYPLVDAGMRQLNETGYMHNRVRMVVASFLVKHLLIDWRWGERYFADKLLDFELSSNNGNWQWAAGTGCDAAPYFRIFNPISQLQKFDPSFAYTRIWVEDLDANTYPKEIVDHKFARQRCLEVYQKGISTESL